MIDQRQKEMNALEHFGERNSLHNVLRQLTETYIVCRDCYKDNLIPKSMSMQDFEAYTISGLLDLKNSNEDLDNESMIDVTED